MNALAAWAAYVAHRPAALDRARRARARDGRRSTRSTSRSARCPLKFLVPGVLFLLGFQIVPILYTINVAFTNYSTGHVLSKNEAITQIQLQLARSRRRTAKTYSMAPARDTDGDLVLAARRTR